MLDWIHIRMLFDVMRMLFHECRIPTIDEIDAYKASVRNPGIVPDPISASLDFETRPYRPDKKWTEVVEVVTTLSGEWETRSDEIPDHLKKFRRDHLSTVTRAIEREELSLEFLDSWGHLNYVAGVCRSILATQADAKQNFAALTGGVQLSDVTLQSYWYAHWMTKRGYLGRKKDWQWEQNSLASLCNELATAQKKCPRFSAEWFATMITDDPESPGDKMLKKTYLDLPRHELTRMLQNRFITKTMLPPLLENEFPETTPDPRG